MKNPVTSCLVVAAATLALAGCDKPKDRTPPAASTSAPKAAGPRPALPAWSQAMLGKAHASLFPGEMKPCVGNTDVVEQRYVDGAKIVGWGWDPATKAPIARVILVDVTGLVAGAGETGVARPDVTAARPEITSPTTGWAAYTGAASGPLDGYGIIDSGKSLCRLGRLEF
jgi:hypothetical protein